MKGIDDYLIEVCRLGILPLVEILLENGADVQAWGNYAIRWTSDNGHLEIVELLKQNGAI